MNIENRKQVSREAGNGEAVPDAQYTPGTDHRESAETYRGVIFDLGDYRVARCRDDIQWLFQRRRPGFAGVGPAWDSIGFCTTRKSLMRLQRSKMGVAAPELLSLPDRYRPEDTQ